MKHRNCGGMEPPPGSCRTCGDPVIAPYRCCTYANPVIIFYHRAQAEYPPWMLQLVREDFSKTCARDRVCITCGGGAFCGHCCGEHHQGHDTADAAEEGEKPAKHRRDSFCIGCGVAFCSELCAHHSGGEGHEVVRVDEYEGQHFVSATGSERWFSAFDVLEVYEDDPVPCRGREQTHVEYDEEWRSWMLALVCEDFSKACARDRVCDTCGGVAFCGHCCAEHHQGHDTADAAEEEEDEGEPAKHRRDSFCIGCRVAFCSELCTHHAVGKGHEIIPIDKYGERHFARVTGLERWFSPAFDGIERFEDEDGNLMVPLQPKVRMDPEPGLKYATRQAKTEHDDEWMTQLAREDFSKTCARDRVCNTCGGAAFCGHCCGAHHQGHDTTAVTAEDGEKDSAATAKHRRDSFCIGCRVAFCSELCAHHNSGEGHEIIPVDAYGERHFVRATGSEWWFSSACGGINTFEDEAGNLMVPLQRRRTPSLDLEPGLKYHATRRRRT